MGLVASAGLALVCQYVSCNEGSKIRHSTLRSRTLVCCPPPHQVAVGSNKIPSHPSLLQLNKHVFLSMPTYVVLLPRQSWWSLLDSFWSLQCSGEPHTGHSTPTVISHVEVNNPSPRPSGCIFPDAAKNEAINRSVPQLRLFQHQTPTEQERGPRTQLEVQRNPLCGLPPACFAHPNPNTRHSLLEKLARGWKLL